jgi:PKD repeat protein
VNFVDQSSNAPTAWSWSFPGGTPSASTLQNPSVVYSTAGTYDVTLTAANAAGEDSETRIDYITVAAIQPPVADFTKSADTVAKGGSVTFTDLSTNAPTSWSWSFPGGTPAASTLQNPSVVYNTPGTYDVSLTAANSAGDDTAVKIGFITVDDVTLSYCPASGGTQKYEYIRQVTVADLNRLSGASAYSDFTASSALLTPGAVVNVALAPGFLNGSYNEYWKIWIDYNQDGDFQDAGEAVFSGSGKSAISGSFTVPATAGGTTRMRVAMRYDTAPPACGVFDYGEVEDYTVNIE